MICKAILENCEKPATRRGYCVNHYRRFMRWGSPYYRSRIANGEIKTCTLYGCEEKYHASGLCKGHQSRLRARGTLLNKWGELEIDKAT